MDGQELGPLFAAPTQGASPWFIALLLLLVIPGVIVALWGILTGRLPRIAAGLGLFAIPALVFTLANAYLLEKSKDIRFCGSCHVMDPIVESALGGGSELAARHIALGAIPVKEACYSCHTDYGVWGTVQAKSQGAMHIVRNAVGAYTFPLEHSGPYPVAICLHCHAQSEKFRAEASHTDPDTQKALLDGSLTCFGVCHADPHPESALYGPGGKPR